MSVHASWYDVTEAELLYDSELPEVTVDDDLPMGDMPSDQALFMCLDECGSVNLKRIRQLSGKSYEQITLELGGTAIVQDPKAFEFEGAWSIEKGWVLCMQYLRGNRVRKLKAAQRMNNKFPGRFDTNVRLLRSMLPPRVSLDDVYIYLGAPWIPDDIKAQFIKDELLQMTGDVTVVRSREANAVKIDVPDDAKNSLRNKHTFGVTRTKTNMWTGEEEEDVRMTAVKIIEHILNGKTTKIYDYIPTHGWNYERRLNGEDTLEAQEKEKLIISLFNQYARSDPRRKARLEEVYNDTYTSCVYSRFDGSFLRFADMNPAVKLHKEQRDGIARVLLSDKNTLFAHRVGSGKTYIIVGSAHELHRMGRSRKTMVVEPNNVLQATVDAHHHLYPDDKILVVYPEDFTPKYRQATLEKIRDGDYVAVYIASSSFDMIVMSKEHHLGKKTDRIRALRDAAANCQSDKEKAMLKKQANTLEKQLQKDMLEKPVSEYLTYEQLGITTLIVDEAHNYKNITVNTVTENVIGMHTKGSDKCDEMLEKCHTTDRVVFATGTPIPNSLTDLFALQTYLQPDELEFRGISSFNMWASTFAERQSEIEIGIDGRLRTVSRFARFHNITELMSMFSAVCDFHYEKDVADDLPQCDGYIDVIVPINEAQAKIMKQLQERNDNIREGKVPRTEDNPLKITTDGRKCGMDPRFFDVDAEFDVMSSKIGVCAKNIKHDYDEAPGTCQVVFSDIGTPKSSFNVYDELRRCLEELGIPRREIAYVHDATTDKARERLFANINAGIIRVVIGSTQKLGVGVNIQERLYSLHHLSIPWRPADWDQRDGRIERRGNTCRRVKKYRYSTAETLDAYSWQLLQNKQQFISDFFAGVLSVRDADDIADAVLSYAEVKAQCIGDPLIKKRVEVANLLEHAKIASRRRQNQIIRLREIAESVPEEVEKHERIIDIARKDAAYYAEHKQPIPEDERQAFGEELLYALSENVGQREVRVFEEYRGFSVDLPAGMRADYRYILLHSPNGGEYGVDMNTDKPLGCSKRIEYELDHLGDFIATHEMVCQAAHQRRKQALEDIEKGNPYREEIDRLTKELTEIDSERAA